MGFTSIELVGTKYSCGIGQCGACNVHIDESAVQSCLLPITQMEGKSITTIEGLSEDGSHPVQEAWKAIDVPQCGYCQAGQIMTATAFLEKNTLSPTGLGEPALPPAGAAIAIAINKATSS